MFLSFRCHPLFVNLSIPLGQSKVVATMLHDGSDFKLGRCTDFNIRWSSPRDHTTESVVGDEPYPRFASLGFGVFGPRSGDDITTFVSREFGGCGCVQWGIDFELGNLKTTVSDRSLGSCAEPLKCVLQPFCNGFQMFFPVGCSRSDTELESRPEFFLRLSGSGFPGKGARAITQLTSLTL